MFTSSDSCLGGLTTASGGLANALGGLATTPDDVFFVGGGGGSGSSARAQKHGKQVSRAASKRFSTEDEARHEQWKAIQAVHPRSTWAPHAEERSTEFLVTTIRLSYSRRYMLRSKNNRDLDCYYLLRARLHKGFTSCSKPKGLFL